MDPTRRFTVVSIQLKAERGEPLRRVHEARALPDRGLEGDRHSLAAPGRNRQVLVVDASTLDHFGLSPGDLREQITVRGAEGLESLPPGTRLRVGQVRLVAVEPCEPCTYIGKLLGRPDPEAFRRELEGRRGLLCRVAPVEGDRRVRVGDSGWVEDQPTNL